MKVLLTGATGYVGGRLLPLLAQRSNLVINCLARQPQNVALPLEGQVNLYQGDLLEAASLTAAFEGVDVAFFLAHALGASKDFEAQELQSARNFASVAQNAGVKKIIYLGGLGEGSDLSAHLKTRQAVGEILRASGIPVIEFRASIIIGSGSLSFELVRALTEKLPIMITPRWVYSRAQPIAIRNVLEYLLAALDLDCEQSVIYEIGGPDQVAYADLMQEYANQRGLKRWFIPVPFLTPWLSSLWLGLVTPVYARIGRKLIESLVNDTIVHDQRALKDFAIRPMGFKEAIVRAIDKEDQFLAETHWYDAISSGLTQPSWGGVRYGTRLVDVQLLSVDLPVDRVFPVIQRIGGSCGWYYADILWRIRGFIDLLVGGVGLRRGRPHPYKLKVGDAVDFWRVEAFEPNKVLRLRAEMLLPGRAWLQFETTGVGAKTFVTQTAMFDPLGLLGLIYWYSLYPLHFFIFRNMLRNICRAAQSQVSA